MAKQTVKDLQAENKRLRHALRDIANPMIKWRRELRADERLNGSMCIVLLADPETYKDMARRALAAKEECDGA